MPPNVGEIKLLDAEGSGEDSTSRYHSAIAPGGVMRKVSKWLPVYTPWTDVRLAGALFSVDDVDPAQLQCKLYVADGPGGIVRCHELRFINPEGLEWYMDNAEGCKLADRHHRCTCCLEWIYGCATRSSRVCCSTSRPSPPSGMLPHAHPTRLACLLTSTRLLLTVAVCNRSNAQRCCTCSQPLHIRCAARCA